MKIHATHCPDGLWLLRIIAKNGTEVMRSRLYVNRRNALAAAKLIAGSKLKVVVKDA